MDFKNINVPNVKVIFFKRIVKLVAVSHTKHDVKYYMQSAHIIIRRVALPWSICFILF